MRLHNVDPPTEWGKDLGDPVAVIRAEPDELARKLGLTFIHGHDDLDYVRLAAVSMGGGRRFLLVSHQGKPGGGTEIISSTTPSRDLSSELTQLLHALHVGLRNVVWTHPQIMLTPERNATRKVGRSGRAGDGSVPRRSHVRVMGARAAAVSKRRRRSK